MRVKRARQLLIAAAAASVAGAAGLLAWGCLAPVSAAPIVKGQSARSGGPSGSAPRTDELSLASFSDLWDRRLRKPLRDDPQAIEAAARKAQAAQQKLPLPITLMGTMVEAEGFSRAMFSAPPGNVELKGVGESVGLPPACAEVVTIEPERVTVRYQGRLMTMRLKGADER